MWKGHALTLICEELRISVPVRWLVCSVFRCHNTGGDAFRCGDVHFLCLRVYMPIRNTVLLMRGVVQGAASKNRSCLPNFLCSSARKSFTLSVCVANLTSFSDVANFFDMFYNIYGGILGVGVLCGELFFMCLKLIMQLFDVKKWAKP